MKRVQHVTINLLGEHRTCKVQQICNATKVHVARTVSGIVNNEGCQVAMLEINLQITFVRVRHEVIWKVLERADVWRVLLEGTRMSYAGCFTQIIINNSLTSKIPVFLG